jgi:hypothetical protein
MGREGGKERKTKENPNSLERPNHRLIDPDTENGGNSILLPSIQKRNEKKELISSQS